MVATPINTSGERTDIIYGVENIIDFTIQSLLLVQYTFDVCTDSNGPSVILSSEKIKKAYYGLRKKGVKVRCVSDITDYNLSYCKQVMECAELRHLDGVSKFSTYSLSYILAPQIFNIFIIIHINVN